MWIAGRGASIARPRTTRKFVIPNPREPQAGPNSVFRSKQYPPRLLPIILR
jgi:hypothetical protein